MDAYILFFILILALFLGFAGLEVPIIGLIGTAIALGVIVWVCIDSPKVY